MTLVSALGLIAGLCQPIFFLGSALIFLTQWRLRMTLDDLKPKADALAAAVQQAAGALSNLSSELKAAVAANDPAKIQAIADALDANTAVLTQAVAAISG